MTSSAASPETTHDDGHFRRQLRPTGPLGIAATFIGTTIGAGYASGQEILQYFVSFGILGGMGALAIAGALFFALSLIILLLAQRLRSAAIHDLVNPTRSSVPTVFADVTITVSLVGTLVIMLAGAGAALQTALGWAPVVGAVAMAAVCVVSMLAGIAGLVRVQAVVVPLIIVVAVGVALWGLANPGPAVAGDVADLVNSSPMINQWWISGILYVAFNFQLAYAVLAPVGRISSSRPGTLAVGAGLGALGLVVMAAAIMLALSAHATLIGRADLPMVELAGQIAPWIAFAYTAVLLLAQFTTALSCLYGAATRLSLVGGLRRVPLWALATATAAVAVVLSLVGFSDLIGWVYPALGYAGMVIILLIVARWAVRRRDAAA